MAAAFEELATRMRNCSLCQDLPLGPNPIFQLSADARVLIVGQAPGRITHTKGRPFDDPSGTRLRAWMGIDRATFYDNPKVGIFPMALCFPGTGSGGDKPPPAICADTWRSPMMQCMNSVELTLVLGAYAIGWHCPHLKGASVTEAVKRSRNGENNAYVLPHPSPRNNRWLKQNPWFENSVIPEIQAKVAHVLS